MALNIHRVASATDWRQAKALLHDYVEWMRAAGGFDPLVVQPSFATELEALDAHGADDDRSLFLAYLGDVAVGTIAVRCHGDGTAELKRMYVRPVARGQGVADALIGAVVRAAADRGCSMMWLETVRGVMDRAIAVYRRNGFAEASASAGTLPLDGLVVMERNLAEGRRCA